MLKIKKEQDFDVVDDDWFGEIPRINLGHLYARQELYHRASPPTLRLSFYMAAGDPNLDPHVYVAGSLLTEPSLLSLPVMAITSNFFKVNLT